MKTIGFFVVAIMIAVVSVFPVAVATPVPQDVNVTVDDAVPGLEVTPSQYGYGHVVQGQCSGENPDGPIYLNSTGNVNITVTTIAGGSVFTGIDYRIGSTWIDVNDFGDAIPVLVPFGTVQPVNTQICILSTTTPDYYDDTVTFEYISAP